MHETKGKEKEKEKEKKKERRRDGMCPKQEDPTS